MPPDQEAGSCTANWFVPTRLSTSSCVALPADVPASQTCAPASKFVPWMETICPALASVGALKIRGAAASELVAGTT
jgi:hypothetical protein